MRTFLNLSLPWMTWYVRGTPEHHPTLDDLLFSSVSASPPYLIPPPHLSFFCSFSLLPLVFNALEIPLFPFSFFSLLNHVFCTLFTFNPPSSFGLIDCIYHRTESHRGAFF